jgi:hypothetical protein
MDDRAERIRVLWNKGRNMGAAAFTELEAVRQEIADEEKFVDWCIYELHISSSIIYRAADLLKKVDADRVKADLAQARKCERDQKRAAKVAITKRSVSDNKTDNKTPAAVITIETDDETQRRPPCQGRSGNERLKAYRARHR